MNQKKIKIAVPIDLLVQICKANKPAETLDQTIERYVRKGMEIEGKL